MHYQIQHDADPTAEDIKMIWQGISLHAKKVRGLNSGKPFAFFIRNDNQEIIGGCSGYIFYGNCYVDLLWIHENLRRKKYGMQLMQKAEELGRNEKCVFMSVNTMDFEALDFYKKLGFYIEFERSGFEKNSSMFFLRKDL